MDIRKINLLFNTLKHLKFIQIYFRVYYLIRNKFLVREPKRRISPKSKKIVWNGGIPNSNRYFSQNSFEFLNIKHDFSRAIDWNLTDYGKLWTYNLNYFDFLNQSEISVEAGLTLILDYVEKDKILKDGKEPYPVSLRLINWIKFLSQNQIKNQKIDEHLYHHTQILSFNLEYHLLANHLLENAFALLFGAYYFQDQKLYVTAKKLLIKQLNEQILKDGAHYELSPMYHQILFHRLLDCIHLIEVNSSWQSDELLSFMRSKASVMRSWLTNVTYQNGDIPMVSDSAFGIAPTSNQLFEYSDTLKISNLSLPLLESGYRKVEVEDYELFVDVGNIQPSYQPGHTHSDTFHFELYKGGNPIFVDTGVSTYEKNQKRQYERSTSSHNTVVIDEKDQTQVWGGFRVGRRAEIIDLSEEKNRITATHNGYKKLGFLHKRSFEWNNDTIIVKDDTLSSTNKKARAHFHLHSNIDKPIIDKDSVHISQEKISIHFRGQSDICIEKYDLPKGFNQTKSAYKIIVTFDQNLSTEISL